MLFSEDVGFGNQVYNKLKKNKSDTSLFQKCEEYLENDERYDSLLWILTEPNKNHFPFMFFRLHLKISGCALWPGRRNFVRGNVETGAKT